MENSIAARKASFNESFSVLNFMWTSVRWVSISRRIGRHLCAHKVHISQQRNVRFELRIVLTTRCPRCICLRTLLTFQSNPVSFPE